MWGRRFLRAVEGLIGMMSGQSIGLLGRSESDEHLLEDPVSEVGNDDEQSGKVLFAASFEELARSHVQYETIIWVLISLLLVLAWGIGFIMLLYLPVRRHVLKKDIASRRLYITYDEIVYKATRPSILPFLGLNKIEKHIPLHLVIDIVIEQGCLQSIYGIHTFRIASIAHQKVAPVDELQFQGVSDPKLLRKVIIIESSRSIREFGHWKTGTFSGDEISRSLTDIPSLNKWQSSSMKLKSSSKHPLLEGEGAVPADLLLHKIEEVRLSVHRLESFVLASHSQTLQDCRMTSN
ncbi:hypothetical protein Cni_G15931 [Canna indica]|uniref:DUF7642 domain-containing protein n=1 Tax=Canna indica TaxID=4628 RepID=A0AAQ3KHW0_9LILI|nr:hypothetical protein Cni_G15931 [Canna indica]